MLKNKELTLGVACVVFSQMGEDNVLYLLPKNNEPATKRQLYTLPPSVQGMGKSLLMRAISLFILRR